MDENRSVVPFLQTSRFLDVYVRQRKEFLKRQRSTSPQFLFMYLLLRRSVTLYVGLFSFVTPPSISLLDSEDLPPCSRPKNPFSDASRCPEL